MGYSRAGFDVTGVDNRPQKHYPFTFVLGDALEYVAAHGHEYDAIHASPPCQRYSEQTPMQHRQKHPDLIGPTHNTLIAAGIPFVIENVECARHLLDNPVMLCGTMFGLNVWRHRYFEINPRPFILTTPCDHTRRPIQPKPGSHSRAVTAFSPVLVSGVTPRDSAHGGRFEYSAEACRLAMETPWMTRAEMDEAIPPAYTEYIGGFLLEAVSARRLQGTPAPVSGAEVTK